MATLEARLAAFATRVGNVVRDGLALKADDSATVHKTGTETVNGVKTFGSAPVVPTGAAAGNPVRRDDARLADTRDPNAHAASHRQGGSDPLVPAPRTVTYSATPTVTATSGVELDRVNITATGAITALALAGGFDGQRVEVTVLASGGTRAVTVAAAVDVSTGVTRGPYSPVSTKLAVLLFRYSSLNSKWSLVAATVTSA